MHFYTKQDDKVQARHFVPMAKDPSRNRPSRVSDAKKALKNGEQWFPSVTTVLNVLDKPALVNWKVDQHLQQAFSVPPLQDQGMWIDKVKSITRNAMDVAPSAGTDMHKILEDHVFFGSDQGNKELLNMDGLEFHIVHEIEMKLDRLGITPQDTYKEEYFLDDGVGYAGCADLVVRDDECWVIDYKTKLTADKFKPGKMAYPDHTRQLAAYGMALFPNKFRAANIFICLETGDIDFHEHSWESLENGWLDFVDCLNIFKRNTFNPTTAA